MSTSLKRPIEILMVDDNPGDIWLTQQALQDAKIRNHLRTVEDGEEALACLRQEGPFQAAPRPDLILLDLNLPKKTGFEVLAEIKADGKLKQIPVVILTTSQAEKDIAMSYTLHANAYISKPVTLEQFSEIVHAIEDFWFQIVTLPPEGQA
jgi:two-component system, chemotaxis family, response regulator Rcp1